MAITVATSKQFAVNFKDIAKGLIVAALTPVVFIVQASLEAGSMTFNFKQIAMAAVAGFVGYLIKNFFTPAQTIVKGLSAEEDFSDPDKPRPPKPNGQP